MARTRGRTGYGQLLLLAALLFGIVTMHTLGHPSGGHEGAAPAAGASSMAMGRQLGAGHDPGGLGLGGHALGERGLGERGGRVAVTVAADPAPHGGMSMDPLSVCLAVLGAVTLLLLVRAGLLRPGGAFAPSPAPRRIRHALRPDPPPPRILLAHLSVLRI
ncbi:hypothetical protein ABZS76_31675 [Streptomyces sp. NPDC005562]|uniref:hypothetical protein n=1 Tax=unclassified Streptomyces TaxID=2593676 RepID=UPI0033BC0E3B